MLMCYSMLLQDSVHNKQHSQKKLQILIRCSCSLPSKARLPSSWITEEANWIIPRTLLILGFHTIPWDKKDNRHRGHVSVRNKRNNQNSFVKSTQTWPPWRQVKTGNNRCWRILLIFNPSLFSLVGRAPVSQVEGSGSIPGWTNTGVLKLRRCWIT